MTSVLSLHYLPETVHCSTKDAYTSEITFISLKPWARLPLLPRTESQVLEEIIRLTHKLLEKKCFSSVDTFELEVLDFLFDRILSYKNILNLC